MEGDDVWVREVFQQLDLGIDQLGQRGLVVHGRLERLESEHLRSSSEKREDEEAFIDNTAQHELENGSGPCSPYEVEGERQTRRTRPSAFRFTSHTTPKPPSPKRLTHWYFWSDVFIASELDRSGYWS